MGFAQGIALFPFIILNSNRLKSNKNIVNHEKIHLAQQRELLILPFYLWYLTEFLIRYIRQPVFRQAYESISFEREAFTHASDPAYLTNRKVFSFLAYL
jgi:hypothetical protein